MAVPVVAKGGHGMVPTRPGLLWSHKEDRRSGSKTETIDPGGPSNREARRTSSPASEQRGGSTDGVIGSTGLHCCNANHSLAVECRREALGWVAGGIPPFQVERASITRGIAVASSLIDSGGSKGDPNARAPFCQRKGPP